MPCSWFRRKCKGRRSLLSLLKKAKRLGWKFCDDDSLELMDFMAALRQSAYGGTIAIWGRRKRATNWQTNNELLVLIPKEYWLDHAVSWAHTVVLSDCKTRLEIADNNFLVGCHHLNDHRAVEYVDLHVDIKHKSWLKHKAVKFKGAIQK